MTFAYHRSLTPIIGVLLGLAMTEAVVVHLVAAAYWGWRVAVPLAIVDGSLVVALLSLLRSMRRQPITLAGGVLTLRTGSRLTLAVPVADIAGFREQWNQDDLKQPGVLNMALATWPNVVLDLKRPVARRRKSITAVAHCVDDPAAFRAAIAPGA